MKKEILEKNNFLHVPKIFLSREEAKKVIYLFSILNQKKEINSLKEFQELKKIITERESQLGIRIFIVTGKVIRKERDIFSDVNPKYEGKNFYILELDTGEFVYLAEHWLIDKKDWAEVSEIETGTAFKAECYPWGKRKGKAKYRLAKIVRYFSGRNYDYVEKNNHGNNLAKTN